MGAEKRQPDPNLSDPTELDAQRQGLLHAYEVQARRFSFYRLIYMLERVFADTPRLGMTGPASGERIRLRSDPSLVFASSDVSDMQNVKMPDGEKRMQVTCTFMGLYGSTSPLPTYFVEEIALSVHQGGPQPVREILDVLHHRLLSLVYRAWCKYRHHVGYLLGGGDTFSRRMFCAVGLDGFGDLKTELSPFYYLRFAPLLAGKSRSARGLQVVLDELFGGIGVEIEQFVGHWTLIEKPLRNKLGVANNEVGESLVIGRWVYDGSGRYTIVLGPLQYDDYLSFLPGGHRRPLLQSVINTMTPGIHDVMLELHVDLEAAPRWQIGSPRASTLSRTSWLGGTAEHNFSITIPLEDRPVDDADDDEDRSPPPMI